MRTISLEEHYASPGFLDGPGRELKAQALKFGAAAAKLFEQLCDVGEKRIAETDAAKIDMQVLSLTSPVRNRSPALMRQHLLVKRMISWPMRSRRIPRVLPDLLRSQRQYQTRPRKNWSG